MKVQVQDLGKLRREVQIEIPFDDIRGEYQQVKDQLRNTRLRGFRPGKFPKGWMKSRFRSSMAYEIRERLFPVLLKSSSIRESDSSSSTDIIEH